MIWVIWRQFRGTICSGVATPLLTAAAIFASTLLLGGWHPFGRAMFFNCFGYSTGQCIAESTLTLATLASIALPVVLGVFVGVTVFSRDLERRTHVLGLTQAMSRRRWFLSRILVVFVPVVVAAGFLGFVSYWARSVAFSGSYAVVGYVDSRLTFPSFGTSGLMPVAYTILGLMAGSTCALLLRNTIGAMMLTLLIMFGVLIAFPTQIREHYASPEVQRVELGDQFYSGYSSSAGFVDPRHDSWLVGSEYVDAGGQPYDVDLNTCANEQQDWPAPLPDETTAEFNARNDAANQRYLEDRVECLRALGIDHFENRYHSDRLYGRFQIVEATICLLLSALLVGASLRLTRRLQP